MLRITILFLLCHSLLSADEFKVPVVGDWAMFPSGKKENAIKFTEKHPYSLDIGAGNKGRELNATLIRIESKSIEVKEIAGESQTFYNSRWKGVGVYVKKNKDKLKSDFFSSSFVSLKLDLANEYFKGSSGSGFNKFITEIVELQKPGKLKGIKGGFLNGLGIFDTASRFSDAFKKANQLGANLNKKNAKALQEIQGSLDGITRDLNNSQTKITKYYNSERAHGRYPDVRAMQSAISAFSSSIRDFKQDLSMATFQASLKKSANPIDDVVNDAKTLSSEEKEHEKHLKEALRDFGINDSLSGKSINPLLKDKIEKDLLEIELQLSKKFTERKQESILRASQFASRKYGKSYMEFNAWETEYGDNYSYYKRMNGLYLVHPKTSKEGLKKIEERRDREDRETIRWNENVRRVREAAYNKAEKSFYANNHKARNMAKNDGQYQQISQGYLKDKDLLMLIDKRKKLLQSLKSSDDNNPLITP